MNIAPTNGNRPWEQDLCPLCPSCGQARETSSHILLCKYTGRVKALMHSINLLEHWLVETELILISVIALWHMLEEEVESP
jgi:hypothetical protein